MLHHGVALHDSTGLIRWHWISAPLAGGHDYNGTFPWHWVDQADRPRCQSDLGLALMGGDSSSHRYRLDKSMFGVDLTVVARFFRLPNESLPLMTMAYFVPSVILALSKRERDVAGLLPLYASKEIAKQLKIAPSTVETVRQRLAAKLGLTGHALVSWCAEHREVI